MNRLYDIKDVAKNSGVSSTTDITLSDNSDIFDPASLEKNSRRMEKL